MKLGTRLQKLEARVPRGDTAPAHPVNRWRDTFLALVPDDLRARAAERLTSADEADAEVFASWATAPLARWAPAPPTGFRLPHTLVVWALDPPRPSWMGHHCGTCGLTVPLYLTPSNEPHAPTDLRPFPTCPACGGRTSHAAYYRPDPETRA